MACAAASAAVGIETTAAMISAFIQRVMAFSSFVGAALRGATPIGAAGRGVTPGGAKRIALYGAPLRRHGLGVDNKRRLPVLKQESAPSAEEPERPPWHWVGFGTVAIFAVWLPFAYVAELVRQRATAAWIGRPDSPEDAARAIAALSAEGRVKLGLVIFVTHGGALFVAALAGGLLVGRYGGAGVGVREAALAGLMAALIAVLLSWSGISWVPLVAVAIATLGAALGGSRGAKRRAKK